MHPRVASTLKSMITTHKDLINSGKFKELENKLIEDVRTDDPASAEIQYIYINTLFAILSIKSNSTITARLGDDGFIWINGIASMPIATIPCDPEEDQEAYNVAYDLKNGITITLLEYISSKLKDFLVDNKVAMQIIDRIKVIY